MNHNTNLVRIKGIHHALAELNDTIAFVGGATVSLYADNPDHADVRPTDDIDVLIKIGTYGAYIKLQEKLISLGFNVDPEANITCRYKYQGFTVDILPTDEAVLGFSNIWYKAGFANLLKYQIDENTIVNIFSAPYFVASKLEAFKGRGGKDGRMSQDFEDIVFVMDNRKSLWKEMSDADQELKTYLLNEFANLIKHPNLDEWVSVHLDYATSAARTRIILEAFHEFMVQK